MADDLFDALAMTLVELHGRFGGGIFNDRRHVLAVLSDRVPDASREIGIIGRCIDAGIFDALAAAPLALTELEIDRLATRIEADLLIHPAVALQIVRVCAHALGRGPLPSVWAPPRSPIALGESDPSLSPWLLPPRRPDDAPPPVARAPRPHAPSMAPPPGPLADPFSDLFGDAGQPPPVTAQESVDTRDSAPQPAGSEADRAGDTVVSVFAPDRVAVGDDALVQVFLHLQEQAQSAFALAKEFDDRAARRGARTLAASIAAGTLVQVTVSLPGLVVDPAIDTILWNRQPEAAQFSVRIPATHGLGTLVGTVRVMVDGAPLGALRFKLDVIAGAHSAATLPARIDARRYRRAFVSYASADRAEVLRRVQALRRVGIEVFQDVLDLEPGDRWERELYRHIDECDVVLLFWSSAARASEWVGREIDYAIARQARQRSDDDEHDMPAIEPLPIEGPPIPEPPERLRHLHFNDALLYAIAGEDRLRAP